MTIQNRCTSCDRGYSRDLAFCPWCGSGDCRHDERVVRTLDTECYRNYWLCKVDPPLPGTTGEYEMVPGRPLDIIGMHRMLTLSRIITFNGDHYDVPMITLAMTGANNEQLKIASDAIIMRNLQPWEFYREFNLTEPVWLDTVDLIEIAPGQTSLKEYGGKMHSKKIQDLPIEPGAIIEPHQHLPLRLYCGNDLTTTWDLYNTFKQQIKLRDDITEEYGVNVMSKSDAQIAEAVFKKLVGRRIEKNYVAPGTQFYYRPPAWLKFQNLKVLDLLARSPFTVNAKGGIDMTDELGKTHIILGRTKYHMGVGGLHSTEKGAVHVADAEYSLRDVDVVSYYPRLLIVLGITPPAIGDVFQSIYRGWFDKRISAKRSGDKKTADSLKTFLNGTFGKLGSKWSIFYTPQEFIQVTITGQLALLMLIEMLESCGINVVSGNTDGIVIKCPRHLEWLRDECVKWWETTTGFETEAVDYRAIMSRDVNDYMAITTAGKIKNKGAYAHPVPVATSWPNPTGEICIDALEAYFLNGTPLETTIRACTDIRKFVHVRRVKGGGEWKGTFLGKAVRWYYATGDTAEILYISNGNKVPSSEGCRPLMELPDSFPLDVDYNRYVLDARAMMADLGVQQ